MKPSPKDIEVTTVALLKSIIESGAPTHMWESMLKDAISLWVRTTTFWKENG